MRKITEVIIHCTANQEGTGMNAEGIRAMHMKFNGWNDCGYHYIIETDGSVVAMRPIEKEGAHCYGHNRNSIGIAYIGGLERGTKHPKDTMTKDMKMNMAQITARLLRAYELKPKDVKFHNEYNKSKACPCINKAEFIKLVTMYYNNTNLTTICVRHL